MAKADEEQVTKCSAKSGEVLCEHKDKDADHFSHGLCEECYDNVSNIYYVHSALVLILHWDWDDLIAQFVELSGGLEGGADPPAFQRAEKQRLDAAKRAKEADVVEEPLCELHSSDVEDNIMGPGKVIFVNILKLMLLRPSPME